MTDVLTVYEALIAAGELRPDPEQAAAARRLATLQDELEADARPSLFSRLLGSKPASPRGVYLWGGVGRGKSMLMDLFHDQLGIAAKRRAHFHEFMIEVHARIRDERKKESGDPIAPVAAGIARDLKCLAFDEMVVNNSADAMIISRLFTALIETHGVTVVTTSNRAPSELYKDGLNREHFLPFIALIEQRLDVLGLNGPVDYRLERLGGADTWYGPNGPEATAATREIFFRLTDYPPEDSAHVPAADLDLGGGRLLHVRKSLKGVAVFSFKRLCGEARGAGAGDQLDLVLVERVDQRDEARRLVALVRAQLRDADQDHGVIMPRHREVIRRAARLAAQTFEAEHRHALEALGDVEQPAAPRLRSAAGTCSESSGG